MQVGILSDIHGQLDALRRALDIFKHHRVNEIICGGDLVDRGPDGDAVVSLIREHKIPCVQGNHDEMAIRTQAFLARNSDKGLPIEPLRDETVTYLSGLPPEIRFDWHRVNVYLTHANPWHDSTTYIRPGDPASVFQSITQTIDADIIVLGHTHMPMHIRCGRSQIINPGSVFANYGPHEQTCAILDVPSRKLQVIDLQSGEPIALLVRDV